jgi:O-antigen/teichoic acid export membrane protein
MSLKKNIAAGYVSQIYVALIGVLLLPLYIEHMGAEAYGLVGFFAMLQAIFSLLDLGMTPTVSRETAKFFAGGTTIIKFRQFYRAVSLVFFIIAILGGGVIFSLSEVIATQWLNAKELSISEMVLSLQIIAICIALRWMCGLYRGLILGAERIVWLSGYNIIISTLRFVGVFLAMYFFGFTPEVFFIYQLAIAIIEIITLGIKTKTLLPKKNGIPRLIGWSFKPLRASLTFSLSVAVTSSLWVLVTQTDKLVLSGILALDEYGYFTLAVLVASGIMMISGPISNSILPRLVRLHTEGMVTQLFSIYNNATQLVTVIGCSAAITIFFTAEQLLFAWTGDRSIASQAAPILQLYAAGNGILVIAAFPYYLQYAKGNLKYHLIGNIGFASILFPCIIFFSTKYGALGAGYVWLTVNSIYLLLWVAFVHHKLAPNTHLSWLWSNILKIIIPTVLFCSIASLLEFESESRLFNLSYVAFITIVSLVTSSISAPIIRVKLLATTRRILAN